MTSEPEVTEPAPSTYALRTLLARLEDALADVPPEQAFAPVAFLAAQAVAFPEAELNAARRRALLVFAAGGDPHRALDPEARAVRSLAADLDAPRRRAELAAALAELAREAEGLTRVREAAAALAADTELAWSWLACALLAEELADDT